MNIKKRLFPVAVLVAVTVVILKSNLLSVRNVDFNLVDINCVTSDHLKGEIKLIGQNIILLDKKTIEETLKAKYPCINKIDLQHQFLGSLLVNIEGRIPLARIATMQSDKLFASELEATPSSSSALLDWSIPTLPNLLLLADNNGVIFAQIEAAENSDLPLIFLDGQDIKVGESLSKDLSIKLREFFLKIGYLQSFKGKLLEDYLLVFGSPKVVFALNRDIPQSIASLQLILNKAKIEGKLVESIDLRFDKPVVTYER